MVGAVARNFHEAGRSEILADFLLSGWGTVTPVRRQDDFGVDLYCTLNRNAGQRSIVTEYYSVQVKSNDDPWEFKSPDEIQWLFDHPTPLFLACVDRTTTILSIYHTLPRFLASFYDKPAGLRLTPSTEDEGCPAQWVDGEDFPLSAPIIRVSLEELRDPPRLDALRAVLQYWVAADAYNGALRRVHILRFRMPDRYRVNEVPTTAGLVEQGRIRLTHAQLDPAIKTLVEVVDCVGDQLHHDKDRELALFAALLLRRLRSIRREALQDDAKWVGDPTSALEIDVTNLLNDVLNEGRPPRCVYEGLDLVLKQIQRLELVDAYLS
jgi:hypothetical protein